MRYLYIIFLVSCSSTEYIKPNASIKSEDVYFVSFSKKSGYGTITDRFSCLGRNELFTCELKSDFYLKNITIEVWAFPAEGYDFKGWSGSYNSKENPIFVKVDSDKNIIAEFSN